MLNRDWAKHKHQQHRQEITFISRALKSQENALEQLKLENEELYEKALQVRTFSSICFLMKRVDYLWNILRSILN